MTDRIRTDLRRRGVASTAKYHYFVDWDAKANEYAVYRGALCTFGTTGFKPEKIATLEEVFDI